MADSSKYFYGRVIVLKKSGAETSKQLWITRTITSFGSDKSCNISFKDDTVDLHHAEIRAAKRELRLKNLSQTPIRLNGAPVLATAVPIKLENEDRFQIGSRTFCIKEIFTRQRPPRHPQPETTKNSDAPKSCAPKTCPSDRACSPVPPKPASRPCSPIRQTCSPPIETCEPEEASCVKPAQEASLNGSIDLVTITEEPESKGQVCEGSIEPECDDIPAGQRPAVEPTKDCESPEPVASHQEQPCPQDEPAQHDSLDQKCKLIKDEEEPAANQKIEPNGRAKHSRKAVKAEVKEPVSRVKRQRSCKQEASYETPRPRPRKEAVAKQRKRKAQQDDLKDESRDSDENGNDSSERDETPAKRSRTESSLANHSCDSDKAEGKFEGKKRSKRGARIFQGLMFIFTTTDTEASKCDMEKAIKKEGGKCAQSFKELLYHRSCSKAEHSVFLVAKTALRTVKYLSALVHGIPCVTENFVNECIKQRSGVENWRSSLLDAGTLIDETKIISPFSNTPSSCMRGGDQPLKNLKVEFIPSSSASKEDREAVADILRQCGAVVMHRLAVHNTTSADILFSVKADETANTRVLSKLKQPHLDVDWLCQCILLNQKVECNSSCPASKPIEKLRCRKLVALKEEQTDASEEQPKSSKKRRKLSPAKGTTSRKRNGRRGARSESIHESDAEHEEEEASRSLSEDEDWCPSDECQIEDSEEACRASEESSSATDENVHNLRKVQKHPDSCVMIEKCVPSPLVEVHDSGSESEDLDVD